MHVLGAQKRKGLYTICPSESPQRYMALDFHPRIPPPMHTIDFLPMLKRDLFGEITGHFPGIIHLFYEPIWPIRNFHVGVSEYSNTQSLATLHFFVHFRFEEGTSHLGITIVPGRDRIIGQRVKSTFAKKVKYVWNNWFFLIIKYKKDDSLSQVHHPSRRPESCHFVVSSFMQNSACTSCQEKPQWDKKTCQWWCLHMKFDLPAWAVVPKKNSVSDASLRITTTKKNGAPKVKEYQIAPFFLIFLFIQSWMGWWNLLIGELLLNSLWSWH